MQKESELSDITNNIKEYYDDEIKILMIKKLRSKKIDSKILKKSEQEDSSIFSIFSTCNSRHKEEIKEEETVVKKDDKVVKKEVDSSCMLF